MNEKQKFIQSLQQENYDQNPLYDLMDIYTNFTTPFNVDYLKHIVAATYLDYKKIYPNLDIFILWRVKSTSSFQKNISKTIKKEFAESNFSRESFKTSVIKDILGIKVVLNHIPDILEFDRKDSKYDSIYKLYKEKLSNLNYIESINDWLYGDSDEFQSEESFYKYYIGLLERLEKAQYSQCDEEVEVPYAARRENAIAKYKLLEKENNFSLEISDEQVEELEKLISALEKRLDDKLQNEILDVTLENVFNNGPLLKKLHAKCSRDQSPKKHNGWMFTPDGYVALYENITTESGLIIEGQAQSSKGYRDDKSGVSFHNGMPGKMIPIDTFFELKNKLDDKPLSFYLNILKKIPYSTLEKKNVIANNARKRALKALKHIKIKDKISFENDATKTSYSIPVEEYLNDFKNYHCPQLGTTNAGHNSIRPTVNIVSKSDAQQLEDIIRDKDGLSVLAHALIERYEQYYPSSNISIPIDEEKIADFVEKNTHLISSKNEQGVQR